MVKQINMSFPEDISNADLELIITAVRESYGYDFSNYARASFTRRVTKFLRDNILDSAAALISYLKEAEENISKFLHTITVNVTEIFRDPLAYKSLRENVIPALASYPNIKIWHAGCSTGEEVFSMCILLEEAGLLSRTTIYATDINAENIERAKTGMLPLARMKEYTANYIQSGGKAEFSDYYIARYNHAIINSDLRRHIVFFQHSLVTDQAFNEFHLILCRNVMIYFDRELQNRILQLFSDSMPALGFLSLGIKESISFSPLVSRFHTVDTEAKIFRKIY